MEDAAGFFANVFGGDRFNDYVSSPPKTYIYLLMGYLKSTYRSVKYL